MAKDRMTGSEMIVKALIDQGVDVVFGYPGGAVLPIYDAIFQQNQLRHILVRQEGGAVHAAEGYARSTGKVGVVLVTSGPGATNCVTGLTDALMDSIPVVCLTGQVATHLIGNDAFQEADTVGITRPCTKHNYLVKDVNDLARTLHEAFHVAKSGRPGPVVVDLPKDVVTADGTYVPPTRARHKSYNPQVKGETSKIEAGRRTACQGQAAAGLCRRRRDQCRPCGLAAPDQLRRHGRLPDHADPDGARRARGVEQELPRHGRHARFARGQHGHARLRRHAVRRRALRRPGDRPARRVLAGLEEDPHRHRRQLDQQEHRGRRADHRRLRLCPGGPDQAVEGTPGQARRQGAGGLVGPDRRMAFAQVVHLQAVVRRSSSRSSRWSVSTPSSRAATTSTSRPRSASTRCGRPSSWTSRSPTTG